MTCAVLGIDAAWTETQPSGVALVERVDDGWRVVAVAPSYAAFVALAREEPVDWRDGRFAGGDVSIGMVISAARSMASTDVGVIAVDMPVARSPFSTRREADNAVSREYGTRGCSTHSPTPERPGAVGARLTAACAEAGYPVATTEDAAGTTPRLLEVYPHPALLSLLGADYRVPYKVSRSRQYWPDADVPKRIERLLVQHRRIADALRAQWGIRRGELGLSLPALGDVRTLASLKRHEDALDALVCAWVGTRYVQRTARALGDADAAVWVPEDAGTT